MELNIGKNIKRLRQEKGLTQEQLADLLCISSAAVSKWEAKNTYPDITMLTPLAGIFGVSIDTLMGYDVVKQTEEVRKIREEFLNLQQNGHFKAARELIIKARKDYPHDYVIMSTYMYHMAGGDADNDPKVLIERKDEFLQICNCVLDGCSEERWRLEALNMKAKLLHASGDTDGALKILEQFPTWYQSSSQKSEQLFAKNTPEYKYWNRKNLYGLLDVSANKMVRVIWFDNNFSLQEKIAQIEALGEEFSTLRKKNHSAFFVILEQMVYAELSGKLPFNSEDDIPTIIRVREKQFKAFEAMMHIAKTDEVLRESMLKTYKTENVVKFLVDWLSSAQYTRFVRLRENPTYTAMLQKWRDKTIQS